MAQEVHSVRERAASLLISYSEALSLAYSIGTNGEPHRRPGHSDPTVSVLMRNTALKGELAQAHQDVIKAFNLLASADDRLSAMMGEPVFKDQRRRRPRRRRVVGMRGLTEETFGVRIEGQG